MPRRVDLQRIQKQVTLALLLILGLILTACSANSTPAGPTVGEENQNQNQAVEITDSLEIEKLWQEYIYDAIPTIGNTWEFNSPEEIEQGAIAKFCWLKYVEENGTAGLQTVSEESTLLLFPLETALEYAKRYFNTSYLRVVEIPDYDYDQQREAFTFAQRSKRPKPKHKENNPWGMELEKVVKNPDGTVTVTLLRYNNYLKNKRLECILNFTLKQRADGSLYFVSGKKEYINNHLVAISGEYTVFEKISGFEGNLQELYMLGQAGERAIFAYVPYAEEEWSKLMLLDFKTMTIVKEREVASGFSSGDLKFTGEKIIICTKDKVLTFTPELEPLEELALPQSLTAKINRESPYDPRHSPEVFFGGYDIKADLSQIVYADEIGLKLLDLKTEQETLLAETVPIPDSELSPKSYHLQPKFVAAEEKVITTMTGYEFNLGYTICDLRQGTIKKLDIGSYQTTGRIRSDSGLLEANNWRYDEKAQMGIYQTLYLDFQSGAVSVLELENPRDTGYIMLEDMSYVGQNYAAFMTSQIDNRDSANSKYYLCRVNLKTLTVEPEVLTISATQPHILGVLENGEIIFWYDLFPTERGICLTK
ncbi:MAG TPA: hypothetical protein GXX46_08400 [Peptococcaceae bacterium]|nr:hypothetical protein [Peptococcaceae bacterium]